MSGPGDRSKEVGEESASSSGKGETHRRIVHVDMNAFYAQIEQRDFPEKYAGEPIADRVSGRFEDAGQKGRTVTLKLKSYDHEVSTRQTTLRRAVRTKEDLMRLARRLLQRPAPPEEPARLLGISVSSLTGEEGGEQLTFDFGVA